MKRRVLCVFSVILFFLIFCTLLTPTIEREMQTLVEVKQVHEALKMYNHTMPARSVDWPDGHKLYQVIQGKGWNTGDRIEEVAEHAYYLVEVYNMITGESEGIRGAEIYPGKNYDIVLSASRQPVPGDKIAIIDAFEEREDTYIICYPGGAGNETGYSNFFTQEGQSDIAQILVPMKGETPFLEQKLHYSFRDMKADTLRIYSVGDISQFYAMLPLVFLLALIALMGLFLWGYSCILAKKEDRPLRVWRNVGLSAGLLCCVPLIARRIDLPASLMPKRNILDIAHYRKEFGQILGALKSMGSDLLRQEQIRCMRICAGLLAAAIVLMIVLVLMDCRKKRT